jgi:DNA-directed RNA polymerase I subunit RPA49
VKRLKALRYILLLINFNAALKPGKYGKGKILPPKDKLQQKLDVSGSLVDGLKRKFVPPRYEALCFSK